MKIHLPVFAALSVFLANAQTTAPSFRSESDVVLAPALVMRKSGEMIYGLHAEDFVLEDNGVEQKIRIDDAPDAQPISLVVAVQRSGSAYLHFKHPEVEETNSGFSEPHHKQPKTAVGDLGTMVEQFVGVSKTEVAVVGFDNEVKLLHDFTESVPTPDARRCIRYSHLSNNFPARYVSATKACGNPKERKRCVGYPPRVYAHGIFETTTSTGSPLGFVRN
jgi:hypothetical protein